jgi:diguanylate cyclase (GGDEF)-like protein
METAIRKANVARNLYPGLLRGIAILYINSSLLLLGFYFAGTISLWVPLAYALGGVVECVFAYFTASRDASIVDVYSFRAVPRLALSTAIHLSFAALAPQVGFYFILTLFVVYSIGTMGISGRHSFYAWCLIVVASGLLLFYNHGDWTPHRTQFERTLVWVAWMLTLGRAILFGVIGRSLRVTLQEQSLRLSDSVGALQQRDQSLERANAELQHQATHDALTGLANRVLFAQCLERALSVGHPFAVCVLDLDRFKVINDSLGHGAGDALLKLVSRRLLSNTRSEDTVARAGGDEFQLLLSDVENQAAIEGLVTRWMHGLSEPYRVQGMELRISPSIGIARYPLDGRNSEELLARADVAMYQAKQSGRNTFRFFDVEFMGFSRERLTLEEDLRRALAEGEFRLVYQPKIDVGNGSTRSVEALLRWQHPTRGMVMPREFIPLAEETGLILPIGTWVIGEACRQARAWQQQGMPHLRIAVNVSPIQFVQSDFPERVRDALRLHSLDASFLEIELTEAALMSDAEKSIGMLEQLSRLGVVIAIDDFGTGYSSMSYLQRFPVDKVKIDQSFIRHLETNQGDASIVRAIISLAQALRLKVVAEGVESTGQLDILRALGCDQYQGFLRSAAVTPEEIEALVKTATLPAVIDAPLDRTFSKLARLIRAKS